MKTRVRRHKKNFLKLSSLSFALMLIMFGIVTYKYFSNSVISTFSNQKSLPIYRVDTEEKKVAITFDVNWGKDTTEEILNILDKHKAKATFFLIGKWIDYSDKNLNLVKEINKKGHELGNHSNLHPDFTNLTRDKIVKELEITDSKIYDITHKRNKIFRFPKGSYDNNSVSVVKELGYIPIQWNIDSIDWKEEGKDIEYNRVSQKIKPGSIILFHNNTKYTPENLDKIISNFKKQGYEFVTVSDLIYHENYEINIEGVQKKLNL